MENKILSVLGRYQDLGCSGLSVTFLVWLDPWPLTGFPHNVKYGISDHGRVIISNGFHTINNGFYQHLDWFISLLAERVIHGLQETIQPSSTFACKCDVHSKFFKYYMYMALFKILSGTSPLGPALKCSPMPCHPVRMTRLGSV